MAQYAEHSHPEIAAHLHTLINVRAYQEAYSANRNLATNRLKQEKDDLSLERIELPDLVHQKQAIGMYHTTGLTKAKVADLRDRIAKHGLKPGMRP